MLLSFLKYYLSADTKYGIHSPFLFNLIEEVLEDDRHYYAFDHLEYLRSQLLKNDQIIEVLVLWRKPRQILELGTSLGLSAAYLAMANKESRIITLEGCPNIANCAQHNLNYLNLNQQVLVRVGEFSKTLDKSIADFKTLDLVFIDGHHAKIPTLKYWEKIKKHLTPGALVIFDDIHWSSGMEEAWETVKQDPGVQISIDLFYKGIILWNSDTKEEQHFKIIERKWKPWQMGFWS